MFRTCVRAIIADEQLCCATRDSAAKVKPAVLNRLLRDFTLNAAEPWWKEHSIRKPVSKTPEAPILEAQLAASDTSRDLQAADTVDGAFCQRFRETAPERLELC